MGYPGYCSDTQRVCGYDLQKNEKYCYEKPMTITTVPVTCPSGCSCYTLEDGKKNGYPLCGAKQTLCGYTMYQQPKYCHQLPVTTTTPASVTCPSGCSCYTLENGKKNGYSLCGGKQILCSSGTDQIPRYCHQLPATGTTVTPLRITQQVPLVPVNVTAGIPVTAVAPVTPVTVSTTLVPVSQVAVFSQCFISGNIYNFFHNTSTLKVRFTPEGGSPQDVSVSPVFAGDLVDHYSFSRITACNGITEVRPVYRADPDVCPWTGTFTPSRGTTVTMTGESQSGWDFTYVSENLNVPEVEIVFTPSSPAVGEDVRVAVWGRDDTSITRMSAKYEGVKTDGTRFSESWFTLDPGRSPARKAGDLFGWSDSFDVSLPDMSLLTVTARVCDGSGNERWSSGTVQFGSCSDNLMNRDEEQIDCGGTFCPACIRCTWCGAHVTPLRINGRTADKIDVVFVPDNDYSGNMAEFARDVQDTLSNGYYRNDAIAQNRSKLNLYYLDDEADITAYPACGFTPPLGSCEDFQDATSFADSTAVVHKTNFRDWSCTECELRVFSSEPTSYRTFVHESGHSLFGLKDEYCCDSHYAEQDDLPNIWSSRDNCEDDATAMGWDPDDCTNFCLAGSGNCGSGFWSIDPDVCIMACSQVCNRCGANGMCQYEQACLRRVDDVFSQYP
jgi:hypothetical protein